MTRRLSVRNSLAAAGLLLLGACVVNLGFDMKKSFPIASGAGSMEQLDAVDLSQYNEVADHKSQIKSLDLEYVDVTVTTVNAGKGAHVTGSVRLRQNPADKDHDVPVGALTNFAIVPGSTTRLPGNPVLDAFLMQMLQSQGTFYVVVGGSLEKPADFVVEANMHASIGYETGML